MREYESRDEAERDTNIDLSIVWKCDKCGRERVELPHYNEGGQCTCGGGFYEAGEQYNAPRQFPALSDGKLDADVGTEV